LDAIQEALSLNGEEVDIEKCAEAVHKAYCNYHLKNKGVPYWTNGDYTLLDEATKQIDRETVLAVLAVINQHSTPSLNPLLEEMKRKYDEIIYAVGNKYEGETRHETALRYIKNAEQGKNGEV
jgi:hypothetical protein